MSGRRSLLLALLALLAAALVAGPACAPKRVLRQPPAQEPAEAPDRPAPTRPPATGNPPAAARRPAPAGPAEARARELGIQAAGVAHAQLGKPYRWGGENPGVGFDCSGLAFYSYGSVGIDLPRVVREQARVGRQVAAEQLQPGDLVFFAIRGNRSDHVGVYLGGDRFVHAPRSGQPVRLDGLDDPWWRSRWTGSRRPAAAD